MKLLQRKNIYIIIIINIWYFPSINSYEIIWKKKGLYCASLILKRKKIS
jgi:hypothetical protein